MVENFYSFILGSFSLFILIIYRQLDKPENAVDGLLDEQFLFHTASNDTAPWMMIDLEKPYLIYQIRVVGRGWWNGRYGQLNASLVYCVFIMSLNILLITATFVN